MSQKNIPFFYQCLPSPRTRLSPRLEHSVPRMCARGLFVAAFGSYGCNTRTLAKYVQAQATHDHHNCEPFFCSSLLVVEVMFNFLGLKSCHEDQDEFRWRIVLVLVSDQLLKFMTVKTAGGVDGCRGHRNSPTIIKISCSSHAYLSSIASICI